MQFRTASLAQELIPNNSLDGKITCRYEFVVILSNSLDGGTINKVAVANVIIIFVVDW